MPNRLNRHQGFTVLELLIAMLIGLLLLGGISSLFLGTSRANSLQERLARLQENGRYATQRIEQDLRAAASPYCNGFSGVSATVQTTPGALPVWSRTPIEIRVPSINLPDSGGMRSVNLAGARSTAAATDPYLLSPRFFMQGYRCTTGTACTPALPAGGMFPAAGLVPGARVPNSDILTIRYLRGTGWPIMGVPNCNSGGDIKIEPAVGDDPVNLSDGQLAIVGLCSRAPVVLPIAAVSGNDVKIGSILMGLSQPVCSSVGSDVRLFNFTEDFVTITYYLAFRVNDNPDAPSNAGAQRLTPTLIRRENGVEQEVVRGIDRLEFTYAVEGRDGFTRMLTAPQVENRLANSIDCPRKPLGLRPEPIQPLNMEPGCLWRAITRVEANLLVNSIDTLSGLDPITLSYVYRNVATSPGATTPLPSGVLHGNMPRREFIASIAVRGGNQ